MAEDDSPQAGSRHARVRTKSGRILLLTFSELTTLSEPYLCSVVGLAQESDAQERRWLLALELHSYFIRKLLKKPSFSSSSIKRSSKSCSMTASVVERSSTAERIICTPVCSPSPRTTLGEIRDQIKGLVWSDNHLAGSFERP